MNKNNHALLAGLIAAAIFLTAGAVLPAQIGGGKAVPKKDLAFQELSVEKIRSVAGGDEIRVKAVVRLNASASACSGPFKVKADWRGEATWAPLAEESITNLCVNMATITRPTATVYFNHTVPAGGTYHYQVTIDSRGEVVEDKEDNNVRSVDYTALRAPAPVGEARAEYRRPPCEGVDLVITRIEMTRNAAGGIFIRATVKNLCTGSCRGSIVIEVDESAVPGGSGGVQMPIAPGIDPEASITMFSALGVYTRAGVDCTYTVSVRAEGGCTDRNPANNSCRVTMAAGENSKVHECR